jgi:hypothetical protein
VEKVVTEFERLALSSLIWLPEHGIGYYPASGDPYDGAYFEKYRAYAQTEMGRALTAARIAMVARHYEGPLLDVGVGGGQFVESRPQTCGYDVNLAGVDWLEERGLYRDLYGENYEAATFWDSLEHIPDAEAALRQVVRWAFVSAPIFTTAEALLHSKHFRKDEHFWYWTRDGLRKWMRAQGFVMREANMMECELGREGIGSFAFERA